MEWVCRSLSCLLRRLIKIFLIDGIDVEKNDEGNQAENGFRELDFEERFLPL